MKKGPAGPFILSHEPNELALVRETLEHIARLCLNLCLHVLHHLLTLIHIGRHQGAGAAAREFPGGRC